MSELTAPGGVGGPLDETSESAPGSPPGLGEESLNPCPTRGFPGNGAPSALLASWEPRGRCGWVASVATAISVVVCRFLAGPRPQ